MFTLPLLCHQCRMGGVAIPIESLLVIVRSHDLETSRAGRSGPVTVAHATGVPGRGERRVFGDVTERWLEITFLYYCKCFD